MQKLLGIWLALTLKATALDGTAQNNLMQQEIKHVVVLMLENRSFDNLLGWLYSTEEPAYFIPPNPTLPFQGLSHDLLNIYANPLINSSGKMVYSCPPIQGTPSLTGSTLFNSPPYDPNEPFDHVTKQIFGSGGVPSMLGFLQDYA